MCLPDSLFAVAFKIFDKNSNGYVNYGEISSLYNWWLTLLLHIVCFQSDEFEDVLKRTELHKRIPFNFNSNFILLHFGKNKDKHVSYLEFTKLLHVSFKNLISWVILSIETLYSWIELNNCLGLP